MSSSNFSRDEYFDIVEKLYNKIDFTKYDTIVAISRGGILPGLMFSHRARKPLKVIDKNERVELRGSILVVDDISDSGSTLLKVIGNLKTPSYDTATLLIKTNTKYRPTFWVEEIDCWVDFFYEVV
jgi:hypoxanthine phosphoribosyltransferase